MKSRQENERHNQRYGHRHRLMRNHYATRLAAGETFTCRKCGQPVTTASTWELGHTDGGGPGDYSGPEHTTCNRLTAPAGPNPTHTDPPPAPRTNWGIRA